MNVISDKNLFFLQVAWVHIDRRMILTIHKHIVTRIPRFSVSFDSHKTWLLHINNVQQEDRGYYMCQVNTEPMISQVGYLQVVGKSIDHTHHILEEVVRLAVFVLVVKNRRIDISPVSYGTVSCPLCPTS